MADFCCNCVPLGQLQSTAVSVDCFFDLKRRRFIYPLVVAFTIVFYNEIIDVLLLWYYN